MIDAQTRSGVVEEILRSISRSSVYLLTLRVSLLLILIHGPTTLTAKAAIHVLCLFMLALPRLATNRTLWWLIVAVVAVSNVLEWSAIDNHKFLILYWTLACALWLEPGLTASYLMHTARLLVALAFGFAAVWKLMSGQFVDGSFLYVTFLTDRRLQGLAGAFAGTSTNATNDAIAFAGALGLQEAEIPLSGPGSARSGALALSWATLLIETGIAALHIRPAPRLYLLRHLALMSFVMVTYFVLPVTGLRLIRSGGRFSYAA
jgi:hypothetical protein